MTEIQAHLLRMLLELDEICQENGLKYYLAAGTLIGAIRHRRFLPWDDDADIHMTRADVAKLYELAQAGKLPPNRELICFKDKRSPLTLARYYDTTSTALFRSLYNREELPNALFIDIYMLDPAPEDEEERKKFLDQERLFMDIHDYTYWFKGLDVSKIDTWRRWERLSLVLGRNLTSSILKKTLGTVNRCNDENSANVFIHSKDLLPSMPHASIVPRSHFGEPKRVRFGDVSLCIPENAKSLLSDTYGTSWIEIPKSAAYRSTQHVIWFDIPFKPTSFIKDIKKLQSYPLSRFLDRDLKHAEFRHVKKRDITHWQSANAEIKLATQEINRSWAELELDLDEMESSQDFSAVEDLFRKYFSIRGWGRIAYWRLTPALEDDVLWTAWYPSLQKGDYLGPLRAIKARLAMNDDPLSPRLQKLYDNCVDADNLMGSLWIWDDMDMARDAALRHLNDEHISIVFMRGILAVLIHDATDRSDFEEVRSLAESFLELWPGDGEILYWRALALLKLGLPNEAESDLLKAADHAVNGIVRLLAQDELDGLGEGEVR